MSDNTSNLPDPSHPPFSDELPKDAKLKMSNSSIKHTIKDGIAKVYGASQINQSLENIPKYPELHTLSLFANLAYKEGKKIQSALVKIEGWKLLTTAESKNGYFGAAFWHPANHQIVIAHRGTKRSNIWNDVIKADIIGVYLNNYVDRMSSAATFAEEILTIFEKFEKELNYSIQLIFTGHSLGGWLAQVTTFTTEYLRLMKNSNLFQNPPSSEEAPNWNYHAHTVVFESPGCAAMLRKMQKSFDIRSSNRSIDLNTLDITTYLSAPNIINTCNEHLGTYFRLITDLSEVGNKTSLFGRLGDQITANYTRATHSKEKIQALLLGLEGKPISEVKAKVKEILDWPTLDIPKRKDYKKLFKEDLFYWANNYHLDPTGNKCVDENGLCVVRYQTKDFDERYGYLSIFTPFERKFLERYVWIQKLGSPIFQPHEWFRCYEKQESRAIELLGDVFIEKNKFHCSNVENLNEIVPLLKRLLKLNPSIDEHTQHSITEKGNVKKIFEFEAKSYRESFKRKSSFLNVNVESFGVRDFLVGETRIWCAIAPGSTGNEKSGITLVYSALKKILEQKATCFTDDSYTILKLKRFRDLMQQKVDVGPLFEEGRYLMVIDCGKLNLYDSDKALFGKLFEGTENKTTVKLILVCSNERQEKVIMDLIEKHRLYTLCVQTTITALKWADLTSKYQRKLLGKHIRLAGSSYEISLKCLLGDDPPPELGFEAMTQLIEANNAITIGSEPLRLSDSEAAYVKRFETIKIAGLREALLTDVETLFIIDGLPSSSPDELIKRLGEIDDEKGANLTVRIGPQNNIRLVSSDYSEQKFRQSCHDNPLRQAQWISFESHSGDWFWKQMYDPKFYVRRKLNHVAVPETIKSILSVKKAFESFVVSGMNYNDLLQRLDIRVEDLDETEKERISSRLSVVKTLEDLRNTKLNHKHPVHLLSAESNGSNFQQLVRHVPASWPETREEFYILRNEPLSVIVDHPDTGKSTTLTLLTEERMSRNWVIRLKLEDGSSLLHEVSVENIDQASDFIWKATCEREKTPLAEVIFKHHLRNSEADCWPLLLLFDGFDEINQDQQKKVIEMIKLLRKVFENSQHQIVITTRRHPNLEKDLEMLYTVELNPLDCEDQIKFLRNHWLRRSELLIVNRAAALEKSGIYAQELLQRAAATLREGMATFVGIPMQLRLLAEGFHASFINFANSSENEPFLCSINIQNFYQFFIDAKFDIFYKEKAGFSDMSPSRIYEIWIREKFTYIHQHLARKFIFCEEDQELFGDNFSPENQELTELYRLGFIQKIREREEFEFIHFTFAEYFLADFLMPRLPKLVACSTPNQSDFFYNHILSMPKYRFVRKFIDSMLNVQGGILVEPRKNMEGLSFFDRGIFLHVAVREGNSEIIKFFFETLPKATIEVLLSFTITSDYSLPFKTEFKRYRTPLHIATDIGNKKIVQQLLANASTDVNVRTANSAKRSPLHIAAKKGHLEIVEMLLAKIEENKTSDVGDYGVDAKNGNGMTPLHFAADRGHKEIVEILLKVQNIGVNAKNRNGMTPLHLAAENGHEQVVAILLRVQYIDVNAKNGDGMTPLYFATDRGHKEVVEILVKVQNIDVNAKDNCERTPLHLAAESGHEEVVVILLRVQNIDVNAKDNCGRTPLHLAAESGHEEVVVILLRVENIDVNAKDNCGGTPLHLAAESGHEEVVVILLRVQNFDVNGEDDYGMTPLHLAANGGHKEVVEILLRVQNIDVNAKNGEGMTPLYFATDRRHKEVIEILLKVQNIDVNAKGDYGMAPLHFAADSGHKEVVEILLKVQNIDVNAKDDCGMTPLHFAADRGHKEVVEILLKVQNIDVTAKDNCGMTPLHLAAENGHEEVVVILLRAQNIDVNAKNVYGATPLHSHIA